MAESPAYGGFEYGGFEREENINEVVTFLRQRGIGEEVVQKFLTEKVDKTSVGFLSDEQLLQLGIVALGDRIAIKNHFSTPKSSHELDREKRVEKLRLILNERRQSKKASIKAKGRFHYANSAGRSGNKATQKPQKLRFECGWKHWKVGTERYVQKKTPQGGGSREVYLDREATVEECITLCKSLFFRGGVSTEGNESNMTFQLGNYHGKPISELLLSDGRKIPFTAQSYRATTGLARPRIYLLSRPLENYIEEEAVVEEEYSEDLTDETEWERVYDYTKSEEKDTEEGREEGFFDDCYGRESGSDDEDLRSPPSFLIGTSEERRDIFDDVQKQLEESAAIDREKEKSKKVREEQQNLKLEKAATQVTEEAARLERVRLRRAARVPPEPEEQYWLVAVRHLQLGLIRRKFSPDWSALAVYDWVGALCPKPEHFSLGPTPSQTIYPEDKVASITRVLCMKVEETEIALSREDSKITLGGGKETSNDDTIPQILFAPECSSTPKNNMLTCETEVPEVLMEGDEISEEEDTQAHFSVLQERRNKALGLLQFEKCVFVSKSNVYQELLQIYQDEDILRYKLVPRFDEADVATGDGVLRELYSLFWEQFFTQNCHGDTEVAFTITQDMAPDDFCAVGRIITHEFVQCGVFPVRLAKASVLQALFNEVGESDLTESLLCIVPPKQREILGRAMGRRQPFPQDDLIELLEDFKIKKVPTPENIHQQIVRVATAEFVTKPYFALMKLRDGMGQFWGEATKDEINALYQLSKPTASLVIGSLKATPLDSREEAVTRWLKRYLFESGDKMSATFVRFATGSDVLLPKQQIVLRFDSLSEAALRPRSRTCFSVVILPKNYRSYSQLQDNMDLYLRHTAAWDLAD